MATYKIKAALDKQDEEHLPFIFVIVSVPGMTGVRAGEIVPEDLVHLMALVRASSMSGKRDFEDRIVEHLMSEGADEDVRTAVQGFIENLERAEWRVLSARKADKLLRERLFERVYAVRVRAFARNYSNAELDMHFSIKGDLTLLQEFLEVLRERGLHGIATYLERGTY